LIKESGITQSSISFDHVQSFSFGDYSYLNQKKDYDYARFRVAVAGGYSYRTFTIPDGTSSFAKNYYNKARNGFLYGVELNYYFHRFVGIGINYYAAHFNPEGVNPDLYPAYLSCKTRIQQITPTFNVRVLDRQRQGSLVAGIGFGFADYRTKFYEDYSKKHVLTEKGFTVGMLWSIGYDIPLSNVMALYIQASLNTGVVTKCTIVDETTGQSTSISVDDINEGVGLGRMNLAIGVRFAK